MPSSGWSDAPAVKGFQILELLGEGGFGSVYLARQESTRQLVALKIKHQDPAKGSPNPRDDERFEREAQLCAELRHPHIVQLLDQGRTEDGRLFAAYQYVPGQTLREYLRQRGPLSAPEAGELMTQVLDALVCAHAHGVVHRDLKPQNIMVSLTGARPLVKVLDFGIGALVPSARDHDYKSLTLTNETIGTPAYSAPEQLRGQPPTIKTDVYVWGLVFLECLTGTPAVDGASVAEIFHRQLSPAEIPLPPAIAGHPLGALLRRTLKKDAAQRYASSQALWNDLQAISLTNLVGELGGRPELARHWQTPIDSASTQTHGLELESRKHQITVLCCALPPAFAGGLGVDRLEPELERFETRLRGQINDCVDIATRFGGYVVGTLADRLLVYFGHPIASDSDTPRALRAAIEIRRGFEAAVDRSQPGGRIGIHAGLTVMGIEAVSTGVTSSIAMWLENAAPPGEILVSEAVQRRLAGTAEFEPFGAGRPGGDAPAMGCYRYVGQGLAGMHAPTPQSAERPMVGRRDELGAMIDAWSAARAGAGSLFLVTGEAGIGKSRLVRAVQQEVGAESWGCRCLPEQMNSALFPVLELMRSVLEIPRVDPGLDARGRLERALEAAGVDLPRVMPLFCAWLALPLGDTYQPSQLAPPLQKSEVLGAIATWILARADRRPLLLVFEDLHWADPTTLELLERLEGEVGQHALVVVATARPELASPWGERARVVALSGLGRADIEAVTSLVLQGRRLAEDVVQLIVKRTDGIPLFIEELTRMLLDTHLVEVGGELVLKAGTDLSTIPTSVRDSLVGRLERLGAANQTAQLAAAIGREFTRELLVAVTTRSREDAERDLQRLQDADLVIRRLDGDRERFLFRHALIRDAAYEMLTSATRRRVHKQIAGALEQQFSELALMRPELLAHHHAAAEQMRQAVAYAQRAAEQALQRSTYAEAIAHASHAIAWAEALAGTEAVEAELVANGALIQALMAIRGWAHPEVKAVADRSAGLLQQLEPDSKHAVPTLWSLFTYHHVASNRRTARAVAEQLVAITERSGDRGLGAAAATFHGLALYIDGRHADARPIFDRAVELYDPDRDQDHGPRFGLDSLVLAKTCVAQLRWFSGDTASAFALVASAVAWAREVGHIPSLAIGLLYGATVHQLAGDRSAVAAMAGEILALSEQYGLPAYEGYAAIFHDWATGDTQRAGAIEAGLSALGCKLTLSYYGSLVADSHAEHGDLDAAIACIDHCLSLCRANDEHFYEPELHRRRALYEARRDPAAHGVRASLERAAGLARRQGIPRVEAQATLELLRQFGSIEQRAARLDELLAHHPSLRTIEDRS